MQRVRSIFYKTRRQGMAKRSLQWLAQHLRAMITTDGPEGQRERGQSPRGLEGLPLLIEPYLARHIGRKNVS